MRYLGGKSRISKSIAEVINHAIYGREIQNIQSNIDDIKPEVKQGGRS